MNPTLKRAFLIGLLVVTGLATVIILGMVILGGTRRGVEMGIMSAMGVGYLLLICFAAFTALDHRWWRFPALGGIVVAVIMMLVMPFFAWAEANRIYRYAPGPRPSSHEWYELMEHLAGTGLTLAGFLCLLAFVIAPKMKPLGRLVQFGTVLSMSLLFILFQMSFWVDSFTRNEAMGQAFIILFILSVAGILATALLNKFFGIKVSKPVSYAATAIHLTCPRCQKAQNITVGDAACAFCKLKIKIEIEEPLCPKCGYNLHNLTRPICPECGMLLGPPDVQADMAQAEMVQWAKAADGQRT